MAPFQNLRRFYGRQHDRYEISASQNHGYVPFVIVTITTSFPLSRLHLGGIGVDLRVVGTSFWRGPESRGSFVSRLESGATSFWRGPESGGSFVNRLESGGRANIVSWLESVEGSFRRGRVASFQNWQAKKCHLASNTCFPLDLLIMFVLHAKNAAVGWGHVRPATTRTSLKLFRFPIFWLWAYLVNWIRCLWFYYYH